MTQSVQKPVACQTNSKRETGDLFHRLDAELWFARRLEEQGYHVFLGVTDECERKERIRQAIIDRRCEDVICCTRSGSGKPESYEQAFKRFYGEPLEGKRKQESI